MKKKIVSVLMALSLAVGLLPGAALAAESTDCAGGDTCTHQAAIGTTHGTTHYDTFTEALDAATGTATVTLLRDVTLTEGDCTGAFTRVQATDNKDNTYPNFIANGGITTGKDLTIDFGGYTLTSPKRGFFVYDGGKLTLQNGTLKTTLRCAAVTKNSTLTVASNMSLEVTAKGDVGIMIFEEGATLHVYGSINTMTSERQCIIGNGANGNGGINIHVYDGATLTANDNSTAIYMPNTGTLNITGGTITGGTGIYVKAGDVNISGGTITGTTKSGSYNSTDGTQNGSWASGEALTVETENGYNGPAVVNITGGTFESKQAAAIGTYAQGSNADGPVENFVKGGTLVSGDKTADLSDILAAGLTTDDSGKVVRDTQNNPLKIDESATTQSGPYTVYTIKNAVAGFTYVIQTTDGSVSMASFVMPGTSGEVDSDAAASNTFQVYKKGPAAVKILEFSSAPTFDAEGALITSCLSTLDIAAG